MMYLLDTHILLWWLNDNKELPVSVKKLIANENNEILVSVISIWEIAIKKSLKKLTISDDLLLSLQENNFEILPLSTEHVLYLEQLPMMHNDPFDRLLIAQSAIEDVPLITLDSNIQSYAIKTYPHKIRTEL